MVQSWERRLSLDLLSYDDSIQQGAAVDQAARLVALLRPQMRRYYYDPAKYRTYLEQLGITYPTERAADGSCAGAATP